MSCLTSKTFAKHSGGVHDQLYNINNSQKAGILNIFLQQRYYQGQG